jgi:hypothetical protein
LLKFSRKDAQVRISRIRLLSFAPISGVNFHDLILLRQDVLWVHVEPGVTMPTLTLSDIQVAAFFLLHVIVVDISLKLY